jgi:mono/diheme cytochrome c family protein
VEALLINQCQSCHGVDPVLPAPNSLVTKSDLTSLSLPEPTKTNAEESLARIQNTLYPMPPAPAPPPSDDAIAALKSWIAAGYPDQTCAELPDAGDVADATLGGSGYDGPFTCSTGKTYTGGNDPLMRPGDPCQYCHTFPAAGTVYKTEHEDESCEGANVSNANIVITDANGMVLTLPVNSAGNFYTGTTIAGPFHAKLVYAGGERDMLEAQSSGNCNLCHTPAGDNGAPGRIMLP